MFDNLRDAYRSLRRSPGFALLTVGILALGLGLNAAIFTVVDCVLLRPLGYHDADRIVSLQTRYLQQNRTNPRIGGGDYVDASKQVHGLSAAAYYQAWDSAIQVHGNAMIAPIARVSPDFGRVMGVSPSAGRLFASSDAKGTEALVSPSFAREHFGSAAAALGQVVRHGEGLYTVVGVMPEGFSFPGKTALWLELDAQPENINRTAFNQYAVAKRSESVSPAQLDAELATFSQRLQAAFPEDKDRVIQAVPLQQEIVGKIAPTLHLLLASVAVILLIVCANITHLQLVRATRQMREVAVRSALGASRLRLAVRALLEAALLSCLGCVGALLLALPALRLLVHMAPANLPRLADVAVNWHVLLLSLLVSFVVMAATALLPVWRSWHVDHTMVLRQDSARGLESRGAVRLRSAFLVVQVALTLVLAAAAVLLARQLISQTREDLGFNMEHLYTLDANFLEPISPTAAANAAPVDKVAERAALQAAGTRRLARLDAVLNDLRATPGVTSAELMGGAPLGFSFSDVGYGVEGRIAFAPGAPLPDAEVRPVTPATLQQLQVPLLHGRALSATDTEPTPKVVLVNQALASQQFQNIDPIGKRITCGLDSLGEWWTIVGVVGNVKEVPGQPATPTFYIPIAQHPLIAAANLQFLVHTAPGSQLSEEALRQRIAQTHGDVALTATSMQHNLSEVQRDLRFKTALFQSFAGVSILLAMLGMYGATAYSVSQRTFEFGLRMALGATREQVVRSVIQKSAWVAFTGALLGVGLFFLFTRALAAVVGTLAVDAPAVLLASLTVVLLTLFAAAVPARRASTIDPMRALRMD